MPRKKKTFKLDDTILVIVEGELFALTRDNFNAMMKEASEGKYCYLESYGHSLGIPVNLDNWDQDKCLKYLKESQALVKL